MRFAVPFIKRIRKLLQLFAAKTLWRNNFTLPICNNRHFLHRAFNDTVSFAQGIRQYGSTQKRCENKKISESSMRLSETLELICTLYNDYNMLDDDCEEVSVDEQKIADYDKRYSDIMKL